MSGLKQERIATPAFMVDTLSANASTIRAKVQKYATNRTNADGKFSQTLFAGKELAEFKTKNMNAHFLKNMGFDREHADRSKFKELLVAKMDQALKAELKGDVRILDVALPVREGGGSVDMQRFIVSLEVVFEQKTYRTIVEFKENQAVAGGDEVVENPIPSALQRYDVALKTSLNETGSIFKIG